MFVNEKEYSLDIIRISFLVIFNIIFFVAGGREHPSSVWISHGFIHFSYIMLLVTHLLIGKSSDSVIFGFSLYSISAAYFFLEFIVGLIFIFIRNASCRVALLTQITIAGIYAVLILACMIVNENTAENQELHIDEITFIKENSSRVRQLIGSISDKKANKELE